jgi:hypothetical protein
LIFFEPSAGVFFLIVQDTFSDDTFLNLCRLTEKPDFGAADFGLGGAPSLLYFLRGGV